MTDLKSTLKLARFNPLKSVAKKTRAFKKDKSGIAAMEFAIIAPIMISIYFGLAEVASAINVDRRISHAANVVGDLATQGTEATNEDIEEFFAAAIRVLDVSNVSDITLELTSYDLDDDGNPRLLGMATLNSGQTLPAFDAATVDTRILNSTSGVVVARIAYSYEPLMLQFTDTNINLTEIFLLKPRRSASVPLGDNPDLPVNCTATTLTNINCTGTSV